MHCVRETQPSRIGSIIENQVHQTIGQNIDSISKVLPPNLVDLLLEQLVKRTENVSRTMVKLKNWQQSQLWEL